MESIGRGLREGRLIGEMEWVDLNMRMRVISCWDEI
jgi:hypothetical protein